MDAIDRAILKGWACTENEKLSRQTWEEFENVLRGKKLFLFGAGQGVNFYFHKYGEKAILEGIIDNNSELWGAKAREIITEKICDNLQKLRITDISALRKYGKENIIILITSLQYFSEIARQLEHMGIDNYFAVLPMEAKKRNNEVIYDERYYVEKSCKCGINRKKIVFFTMSDYAGHGKEIANQLLKRKEDLELVWIVKNLNVEVPAGIRLVSQNEQQEYIHELETAKMWVCDTGMPLDIVKRDGQIYVQVKHWSSVTLKAFGFELARFRQNKSMIELCERESRIIDYIITGSKFDTETCRRGFAFTGEIFEAGSPRTDILFDSEKYRMKVCNYYHIDSKKKMLLYAPTFRSGTGEEYVPKASHIDLDFGKIKKELEKRFGGSWLILLRLHPVVAKQGIKRDKPKYVIDVSNYYDSEELVAASDMMVTDYSSIMFEPAFVKKPVFLFAVDKNEYIDQERTLLIEYETLPFSIAETNEELAENIRKFEPAEYEKRLKDFFDKYGVHEDGHAGERAAGFISGLIAEN